MKYDLREFDSESGYNFAMTQICFQLFDENKFSSFTRRVVQQQCFLHNRELIQLYKSFPGDYLKFSEAARELLYRQNPESTFRNIFTFLVLWLGGFFNAFYSFLSRHEKFNSFVLVEGPVESYSSLEAFETAYNSRIRHLFKAADHIVLTKKIRKDSESNKTIRTINKPPYGVLVHVKLSFRDLIRFSIHQFKSLKTFIDFTFQYGTPFSSLNRDFLYWPYINLFDEMGVLKGYVKTNSEYTSQQFWLENKNKKFEYMFIWYSINTKYFKFKNLKMSDYYQYSISYIEKSITWAKWHQKWLLNLNPEMQVLQTGPLSFGQGISAGQLESKSVIIFDVLPRKPKTIEDLYVNVEAFYYSDEICIKFLRDIVEVAKLTGYKLYLKHKRKNHWNLTEEKYLSYVSEIADSGQVTLIDTGVDVEDLISKTTFSIAIPFTSTCYVASHQKKKSLYYDPIGVLDFEERDDYGVTFIQSKEGLSDYFSNFEKNNFL